MYVEDRVGIMISAKKVIPNLKKKVSETEINAQANRQGVSYLLFIFFIIYLDQSLLFMNSGINKTVK